MQKNKSWLLNLIFMVLIGVTGSSYAISMSTFKIHLDQKSKEYDFIIYNKEAITQDCELKLKPLVLDKHGKSRLLEEGEINLNSADNFLKFSPHKFAAEIGKPQHVKFKLRAKRNTPHQEYLSYLSVSCVNSINEIKNTEKASVKVMPKLIHNIPIVVRIGVDNYTIDFSNVSSYDNTVQATLNKTGTYSTYGQLKLVNKSSQKVISIIEGFMMPIEADVKEIVMSLNGEKPESVELIYTENENIMNPRVIKANVN